MNKKIICISIIGMFLLTGISSFSAIGETAEKQKKTNDVDKLNETLQPKQEIETASVDEITLDMADIWVEGTGGKEYNDCHINWHSTPYWITIPHKGSIDITLNVDWEVQADQNNWLGEWEEQWYFLFKIEMPGIGVIKREKPKLDTILLDDSESGTFSITFTADESFVNWFLLVSLISFHARKNWFIPEEYQAVMTEDRQWKMGFEYDNQGPKRPDRPVGPTTGEAGIEYEYTVTTTDPEGDDVYYLVNWDDSVNLDKYGPYPSGATATVKHVWEKEGNYNMQVLARDTYGWQSDWSDPLSVTMPRNRAINTPFLNFLHNHPNMFPLIQRLLQILRI